MNTHRIRQERSHLKKLSIKNDRLENRLKDDFEDDTGRTIPLRILDEKMMFNFSN